MATRIPAREGAMFVGEGISQPTVKACGQYLSLRWQQQCGLMLSVLQQQPQVR